MTRLSSSSFLRNITLICFLFFRSCDTRNPYDDLDLSTQTLNPTVTGFTITGNAASDYFGWSIRTAGDINKDLYDDFIVGAPNKDSNHGAAYVIYGDKESSFLNIDLGSTILDPHTTGFMITGNAANDYLGAWVSTAGDINNDGYDDIIVGAYGKNSNQGVAYVIYGGLKSSMSNIDLSTQTLDPPTTGFMITGNPGDYFGSSVSTAGDINNDGYDDIIVGAQGWSSGQGAAYVIYGGSTITRANIVLSSTPLDPTSTGFMITGNAALDNLGMPVNTAGDINNDGYDDIIITAPQKNSWQGVVYVIYGGDKSTRTNIPLISITLSPTSTGFTITGSAVGDHFGASVSSAGDINNDGYDDIVIGAANKNSNQGAAYVIYGGEKSAMSDWDFSSGATLIPTSTGFIITGETAGNYFGGSATTAGDINNDGYHDIIVGAQGWSSARGAAYVIYGGSTTTRTNIVLSSTALDPTSTGFMITGNAAGDSLGSPVNTVGDINGDGYDDIIISAIWKKTTYVVYSSCSMHCKQCFSESMCSECKNSYLMYQYGCYKPCPDTTLATSTTICEDCPTRCKHCSSTSVCTECVSPFVLYDTQCLSSCPITMFNSNSVCKSCLSYCYSCTSQDSCQVCFEGYTLSDSNALCVVESSEDSQQKATKAISSATQGIGSVVSVGSSIFPFSALVSKIVQNTRYLNLSVTSELADVYKTWGTDLISWDVPNVMSDLDHFEASPSLFAQYDLASPFLVNFWPTLINIGIGFGAFIAFILLKKLCEYQRYQGWAYSLVLKLVAGSFNFTLIQAYACLDDILFYLVLDAKTNAFNSFFSWSSIICAVVFLAIGSLETFFNFWTVKKYQSIKNQGENHLKAFNKKNKYWELFYSDFSSDDFWSQSFFGLAIVRSVLSNLVIAVLCDDPLMQTSFLLIIDTAIISFLYFKTPFNTLRGALAQYYFETITLLVHICAFTLALQDTFNNPSDTVRLIMSTGILYLNTALICGTIGFMFIEIYKTISEKKRAARLKERQSAPEEIQETQNLTQRRQDWVNREQNTLNTLEQENNQNCNFHNESFIPSDMNYRRRINHRQRDQSSLPITIRHRPQNQNQPRKNSRKPNYKVNYD